MSINIQMSRQCLPTIVTVELHWSQNCPEYYSRVVIYDHQVFINLAMSVYMKEGYDVKTIYNSIIKAFYVGAGLKSPWYTNKIRHVCLSAGRKPIYGSRHPGILCRCRPIRSCDIAKIGNQLTLNCKSKVHDTLIKFAMPVCLHD